MRDDMGENVADGAHPWLPFRVRVRDRARRESPVPQQPRPFLAHRVEIALAFSEGHLRPDRHLPPNPSETAEPQPLGGDDVREQPDRARRLARPESSRDLAIRPVVEGEESLEVGGQDGGCRGGLRPPGLSIP